MFTLLAAQNCGRPSNRALSNGSVSSNFKIELISLRVISVSKPLESKVRPVETMAKDARSDNRNASH